MNSFVLCLFVFCTIQITTQPSNAQQDILNEYKPVFMKINGIFGSIASGVGNAAYSYRTRTAKANTELRRKGKLVSSEKIIKINEEVESLTKHCRYESVKERCLNLKDLEVGNFTIRSDAGFDTCRTVFFNATNAGLEYLSAISVEISRINKLVNAAKQNCTENISSDEQIRLCLFKNLYSNVLPPLTKLQNVNYYTHLQTVFDAAETAVENCYNVAEDVVVTYYAQQVANNFKYCCIYGN